MSTPVVTYESVDRIARITIRRPDKMNALNNDVVNGLHDAWIRLQESDDRVAVLAGEGSRAFSAGADLSDPPAELWEGVPNVGVDLDKPVIAAITGHCVGGAYVIAQHCDLIVATENTKISYPEAKLGFSGGLIAGAVNRFPVKIAMELMLLGGPLDIERAYHAGIVNAVVPEGDHQTTAMEWAKHIEVSAPLVVGLMKGFSDQAVPTAPSQQQAKIRREFLKVQRSSDAVEARLAGKEKRPPVFKGQ